MNWLGVPRVHKKVRNKNHKDSEKTTLIVNVWLISSNGTVYPPGLGQSTSVLLLFSDRAGPHSLLKRTDLRKFNPIDNKTVWRLSCLYGRGGPRVPMTGNLTLTRHESDLDLVIEKTQRSNDWVEHLESCTVGGIKLGILFK